VADQPFNAPAIKTKHVHPTRTSGKRPLHRVTLLVAHETATPFGSREGVVNFFASPARRGSAGSAHQVIDHDKRNRMAGDRVICNGASDGGTDCNERGIHYELCSPSNKTDKWWMRTKKRRRALKRLAWAMAEDVVAHDIPTRWLSPRALRKGKRRGITNHRNITKAFVPGGHTDCLPVRRWVLRRVRRFARRIRS